MHAEAVTGPPLRMTLMPAALRASQRRAAHAASTTGTLCPSAGATAVDIPSQTEYGNSSKCEYLWAGYQRPMLERKAQVLWTMQSQYGEYIEWHHNSKHHRYIANTVGYTFAA